VTKKKKSGTSRGKTRAPSSKKTPSRKTAKAKTRKGGSGSASRSAGAKTTKKTSGTRGGSAKTKSAASAKAGARAKGTAKKTKTGRGKTAGKTPAKSSAAGSGSKKAVRKPKKRTGAQVKKVVAKLAEAKKKAAAKKAAAKKAVAKSSESTRKKAKKATAKKSPAKKAKVVKVKTEPVETAKPSPGATRSLRLRSQPVEVQEIDVPSARQRKSRMRTYRPRSYGKTPKKVKPKDLVHTLIQYMGKVPRPPARKAPKTVVEVGIFAIFAIGGNPSGACMEAVRRLLETFPDWNEFRISDAIEFHELLEDLGLKDLYDRCERVLDFINDVYQDQNQVDLEFLRDLPPEDRLQILDRYTSLGPPLAHFLALSLQGFEGVLFHYSLARVAQRVGLVERTGSPKVLVASLEKALQGEDAVSAQINMLELGEEVCHSKNPSCRNCYLVLMCKDRKV